MKTKPIILVPLYMLVLYGFLSAAQISFVNYSGRACPQLLNVPVCYVVLLAYALMLGSLIINHHGCRHHFFCAGWGAAFLIALLASVAEFFTETSVCPIFSGVGIRMGADGGLPMCYISLGLLVVILVLFINGPYKNTCDIYNANR